MIASISLSLLLLFTRRSDVVRRQMEIVYQPVLCNTFHPYHHLPHPSTGDQMAELRDAIVDEDIRSESL